MRNHVCNIPQYAVKLLNTVAIHSSVICRHNKEVTRLDTVLQNVIQFFGAAPNDEVHVKIVKRTEIPIVMT